MISMYIYIWWFFATPVWTGITLMWDITKETIVYPSRPLSLLVHLCGGDLFAYNQMWITFTVLITVGSILVLLPIELISNVPIIIQLSPFLVYAATQIVVQTCILTGIQDQYHVLPIILTGIYQPDYPIVSVMIILLYSNRRVINDIVPCALLTCFSHKFYTTECYFSSVVCAAYAVHFCPKIERLDFITRFFKTVFGCIEVVIDKIYRKSIAWISTVAKIRRTVLMYISRAITRWIPHRIYHVLKVISPLPLQATIVVFIYTIFQAQ